MLRIHFPALAAVLLVLSACGSAEGGGADSPFSSADSSVTNSPGTTGGAGLPPAGGSSDASVSVGPLLDSGVRPIDSGTSSPSTDAKVPDSGTSSADSGTSSADSGTTSSADSGTSSRDGGSSSDGSFIRGPEPTAESATKNGPFKVQNATSGFRDGPNFAEATLWWPADADPPFASVAVVPGWVSTEADIREWGPFLASYGIVTLTIGTNSPATDLPPDRAAALLDALMTLRAENTRAGGPLNGKLDVSRQATMGWSMGGGGTLLVAEQTPTLKATISMCAWNPGYSYSKVKVPALLFASQGDPLAGGQSQGFYESIPNSTPKELWEVPGGDHFFFNTPKNQNGVVGRYGLAWLKVYLEGDNRFAPLLKLQPPSKTDFRNNLQ